MEEIIKIMKEEVLKRNAPVLKMISNDKDPFWIIVKAVLSTRTKDEITLEAFKKLKEKFDGPEDILRSSPEYIEKLIKPVGFYKQKARNIIEIAKYFVENGPPKEFEEIANLPGVGRKVARIYQIYALGENEIAVDTHVKRITERIFGKKFRKEEEVEKFLKKKFDKRYWKDINWIFVGFGQTVCKPIRPLCEECPIKDFCSFGKSFK